MTGAGKSMIEEKTASLRELARDFIAIGSIPFLVLTIVRVATMSPYYPMQFIISSCLFFILRWIFKAELRAGIGFILLVFTSLFYKTWLFAVFAVLVYAGVIISLFYLHRDRREVFKGIFLGVLSAGIGYALVQLMFFR